MDRGGAKYVGQWNSTTLGLPLKVLQSTLQGVFQRKSYNLKNFSGRRASLVWFVNPTRIDPRSYKRSGEDLIKLSRESTTWYIEPGYLNKQRWKLYSLTVYSSTRQNLLIQSGINRRWKGEQCNERRQVLWHSSQTDCLHDPVYHPIDCSRCSWFAEISRKCLSNTPANGVSEIIGCRYKSYVETSF